MQETSCRVFSRSNLRSSLASLRVALTARLFSFRSGVRFAITKEYQHFAVPADFVPPYGVFINSVFPGSRHLSRTNPGTETME
jgi:hypothetical protein